MSRSGRTSTSLAYGYTSDTIPITHNHAFKRRSKLATTSMLYSIWKSNQICYDMYNYIGSMKIPEDDVDQRRFRMKKIMQLGNHFARVTDSLQQAKERCIEEGSLDSDFDFEDHDEMMAELDAKPDFCAGSDERVFKFDSESTSYVEEPLEDLFKDYTIDFMKLLP